MKHQNREHLFWGILFLCGAAFVLLNNFGLFGRLHVTSILFSIILVYFIYKGIRYRQYGGILFPLAFLYLIYDEYLPFAELSIWTVFGAALLGTIGLHFLFPSKYYHGYCNNNYEKAEHVSDADVNCSVAFAGSTKYVDTEDFNEAYLKCSFGSLKVFFDHAAIKGNEAKIYVENSFGETDLYLPKEWNVITKLSASFGDFQEIHKVTYAGFPTVTVTGNVSFGECKIYYI